MPQHGDEADYADDGEYLGEYAEDDEIRAGRLRLTPADEYDEAATPEDLKRRNGAKIALAVLGLAVFGTAAAFGYRSHFQGAALRARRR